MAHREPGCDHFIENRKHIIRNEFHFDDVFRSIPNNIFGVIVSVPWLPHASDVDDVLIFPVKVDNSLGQRCTGNYFTIKVYNLKVVRMSNKTNSFFYLFKSMLHLVFRNLKEIGGC